MTDQANVNAAVRRFVEQVTTEWRDGIDDCEPLLEDLIGRCTGPSWDPRWINDLLAMGRVTIDRYGRIAGHTLRLANSLQGTGQRDGTVSSEEPRGIRPRDLATVWGKAFGQVVDLWRTGSVALLKVGSTGGNASGSHCNQISVRRAGGRVPRLTARNLVGESFGKLLDGSLVTFAVKDSGDPDVVLVDCCIDESRGESIQGDIYHGEVVDEHGVVVARVMLDAGS
jgi:hypothetical protein